MLATRLIPPMRMMHGTAGGGYYPLILAPVILLDGHQDATLSLSGSSITAIANLGSLGGSLTQATGSAQPQRLNSSSYVTGKSISFNGSQYLANAAVTINSPNFSVAVVAVTTTASAAYQQAAYMQSNTGTLRLVELWRNTASAYVGGEYYDNGTDQVVAGSVAGAAIGTKTRYVFTVDQSTSTNNVIIYENGSAHLTASKAYSGTTLGSVSVGFGARSGGSEPWIGEIPFLMICDYVLSPSQVSSLDSWLATEF